MENALLVGLSRQMVLMHQLDVVANNIANINTTGFKTDNASFGEYLTSQASDQAFSGRDRHVAFVQDSANWIDMTAGAIERTGNPLNVAVEGNAFLVVQNAQGQQRYTRNGAFSINATGQLVNSEGDQVLGTSGPIEFQQGDQDVVISATGIITARQGSSTADVQRGTLELVTIDQPQRLQKEGGSNFVAPNGVTANPAPPGTRVIQGAIEKSNVNGVGEMARLIQLSRSYTDISNILQQQSDQRRSALSQLSQPPAGM